MQKNSGDTEDSLIKELDNLIKSIKRGSGLNQGQIEERMNYNKGYLSQVKSRGEVSKKLINNLIREFGIGLQNANSAVPIPAAISGEDQERKQSLEKSIENLTQNELRTTAIIERLVTLLEQQYGKTPVPTLAPPGTEGTETNNPRKQKKPVE